MGCIVNGPGESKHADIGILQPGTGEQSTTAFKQMVVDYIERRWSTTVRAELSNSVEEDSPFA
jgi:4-hydroxy-3-methylbut-2-en-1-yl diphosphate synthase IspG/GcpE